MDYKPRKIVNDLRLISLETNLAYYKKTLPYLHSTKIEQMTKTMVILKEVPFFFAAFAAIQYHHKLPSSGSRILATLPLAVLTHTTLRNHTSRAQP